MCDSAIPCLCDGSDPHCRNWANLSNPQHSPGSTRSPSRRLLINLRYLTKHIAFKEEQECRVVKVCNYDNLNITISKDFKQLYLEYLQIPTHVEIIYFGPKATEMELFQDILKHKGLEIPCEQSKHPLEWGAPFFSFFCNHAFPPDTERCVIARKVRLKMGLATEVCQ